MIVEVCRDVIIYHAMCVVSVNILRQQKLLEETRCE